MVFADWISRCALESCIRVKGKASGVIINEHTLTAAEVRAHVELLAKCFDFIGLDEWQARLETPGKRPFCILSFDDGKESNATQVAPELLRLGVPAAFYIVASAASTGKPLWFDRHNALVQALRAPPPGLESAIVKRLPFAVLQERLDQACEKHGIDANLSSDHVRLMTWDQVRGLARSGFQIGAHGVNHAILTNEPVSDAKAEIRESLAQVVAQIGSCTTFAFPNGNYTRELAEFAGSCGAKTVLTTDPRWVDRRSLSWRLPRVQLFPNSTRARAQLKLAAASTGRGLENPNCGGCAPPLKP